MITKVYKNHLEYIPAPLNSSTLTGTPSVPTPTYTNDSTQIASTSFNYTSYQTGVPICFSINSL